MGKVKKHKRKGPKSSRSGCLLCKPQKRQGNSEEARANGGNLRRVMASKEHMREYV